MIISLNLDHSYKKFKNSNNVKKILSDSKYLLVDNTTELKGTTFTLVDASKISNDIYMYPKNIEFIMDISYACVDSPCCDETSFHTDMVLNTLEKAYSIYPLIKQLFDFNLYKDDFLMIDSAIDINSIILKIRNSIIELDEFDIGKKTEKIFRELNLMTAVSSTLNNKHVILKDDKWYFDKIIPHHFDYVAYNLPGIETLYLMSESQFNRFYSIKKIEIDIYDKTNYALLYPMSIDESLDTDLNNVDNQITCTGLKKLLETCIYFPQLLELEKTIYQKRVALRIILSTINRNYILDITDKEATDCGGLCLFKILNKLLQM